MRTLHPVFLAFLLAGCSGGKDGTHPGTDSPPTDGGGDADADTDADSDSDTDADACDATVVSIDPADGTHDVDPASSVVVGFDNAVAATDDWSLAVDGATGSATLAAHGLSATWAGALDPDTDYVVHASACGNEFQSTFRTSPPPVDLESLVGNSYVLDWNSVTLTQPGNGAALKLLINIDYVLAQITAVDTAASTADALGTIGTDDGAGNAIPVCELALAQTADFSQDPYFQIEGNMTVVVNPNTGQTATVEDFKMRGLMSQDGTQITDVELSGLAATEHFLNNADCNSPLISFLNPTCQACTTSATGQCMLIEGTAPAAALQPALDIETQCNLGTGTGTGTGTTTYP